MRPYLRAANVTWNGLDLSDVKEMDFNPIEFERYRLLPGDILLAEASGSADEVAKPAIWRGEINDCCFQNTLIRVRLPSELVPFVYQHLLYDARSGRFGRAARGVGIHHLGAARAESWPVTLPPFAEQHRIVAGVERRLSVIQEAENIVAANLKRAERATSPNPLRSRRGLKRPSPRQETGLQPPLFAGGEGPGVRYER